MPLSRMTRKLARAWVRKTPTQMALDDLNLPISEDRFERAMGMAARYMGGVYSNGAIHFNQKFDDPSFPSKIKVLYRKLPCGFLNTEKAGVCVTFDVIPVVQGDPRRSRIYQSFPADIKNIKTQFGKFLGWLRIVGMAMRKYLARAQKTAGMFHTPPKMVGPMSRWVTSVMAAQFTRLLEQEESSEAKKLLDSWNRRNLLKGHSWSMEQTFPIDLTGWRYQKQIDSEALTEILDRSPWWGEITVSFEDMGAEGSWDPEQGRIKLEDPMDSYHAVRKAVKEGDFQTAQRVWIKAIKHTLNTLSHEAAHMAQSFLEKGLGHTPSKSRFENIPGPGMPSKRIMNPGVTQFLNSPYALPQKYERRRQELEQAGWISETHEVDDAEFYTRLLDEVRSFKQEGGPARARQDRFVEWVTKSSPWFTILRKRSPAKWKKAVKEMSKALRLNSQAKIAARVAGTWLKQSALLEAPPQTLKTLTRMVDSVCYGHVWAQVNKKLQEFLDDPSVFTPEENVVIVNLRALQKLCAQYAKKPKFYKSKTQFKMTVDFSGSRYEKLLGIKISEWYFEISVVLDFQGHANRGGQWDPSKRELQIDVNLNSVFTPEQLQARMREVHRVARHELQHVVQTYVTLGLKKQNPDKFQDRAGLPSAAIRTPGVDPDGLSLSPGKTPSNRKQIPHHQRDIEFYSNLSDDIDELEKWLRLIPKPYWGIAAKLYVGLGKPTDMVELSQELEDRYKLPLAGFRPGVRFAAFKKENVGKWKKAVKELWKEMAVRGFDLEQGIAKPLSLHKVLWGLTPWRRNDMSFGFDSGDHRRTKDGWVIDIYRIENWDEYGQPGWVSRPGKDRWKMLVTPEGQAKQVGGPSKLPGLPSTLKLAHRRKADLSPPLGHPGGTCHVVERIVEEVVNPRLETQLVNEVQRGNPLSNPDARKVYAPTLERGAWKYKLLLSPHAQYRMDLRGITVPEIRAALDNFFKTVNAERSKGDLSKWDSFVRGQKMEWLDPRTNTFFVFTANGSEVTIITTYKPGEPDPRPGQCVV